MTDSTLKILADAVERAPCSADCPAHSHQTAFDAAVAQSLEEGRERISELGATCDRIEAQTVDAAQAAKTAAMLAQQAATAAYAATKWDPTSVYAWLRVAAVLIGLLISLLLAFGRGNEQKLDRMERVMDKMLQLQGLNPASLEPPSEPSALSSVQNPTSGIRNCP